MDTVITRTIDVLEDVRRELEELESQFDGYTSGRLMDKIDNLLKELSHENLPRQA